MYVCLCSWNVSYNESRVSFISNRPDQVKTAVKVGKGPCIEGGGVTDHMTHLTLDLRRRVTKTNKKYRKM